MPTSCVCVPASACLSLSDCFDWMWDHYNETARAVAHCASAGVVSGSGFELLVSLFRAARDGLGTLEALEPSVDAPWFTARLDGAV
jgi:hypothetical protein